MESRLNPRNNTITRTNLEFSGWTVKPRLSNNFLDVEREFIQAGLVSALTQRSSK